MSNYCEHGDDAYSYQTCIRTRYGERLIFNVTNYSATTSRHQSKCFGFSAREIRETMAKNGTSFMERGYHIYLDDIERGSNTDDLRGIAFVRGERARALEAQSAKPC